MKTNKRTQQTAPYLGILNIPLRWSCSMLLVRRTPFCGERSRSLSWQCHEGTVPTVFSLLSCHPTWGQTRLLAQPTHFIGRDTPGQIKSACCCHEKKKCRLPPTPGRPDSDPTDASQDSSHSSVSAIPPRGSGPRQASSRSTPRTLFPSPTPRCRGRWAHFPVLRQTATPANRPARD